MTSQAWKRGDRCPRGHCDHPLRDHRYVEGRRMWWCTAPTCRENSDNHPRALQGEEPSDTWYDPLLSNELPSERRKRLGLRWWQLDWWRS